MTYSQVDLTASHLQFNKLRFVTLHTGITNINIGICIVLIQKQLGKLLQFISKVSHYALAINLY